MGWVLGFAARAVTKVPLPFHNVAGTMFRSRTGKLDRQRSRAIGRTGGESQRHHVDQLRADAGVGLPFFIGEDHADREVARVGIAMRNFKVAGVGSPIAEIPPRAQEAAPRAVGFGRGEGDG